MNAPAKTIADLLTRQAGLHPRRPAITAPDREPLSYLELEGRVADTALALRRLGFGRNDRVALALPNGADMAVTMLSIMTAAAVAPFEHDSPSAEFERYLRGSRAQAVVVEDARRSAAAEAAEAMDLPVIEIGHGGPPQLVSGGTRRNAEGPVRARDSALVLHTSGTTGEQKFVALRQLSLCLSAANIASSLELTEEDRCLNVMPLSHAHGLLTPLLATLSTGGALMCLPGFDVNEFYTALAQFHPTWYSAVPTIHQEILTQADRHRDAIAAAPLRFVRSASSPLPEAVLNRLESTFDAPVIESYGMTETTSVVASNPLPPKPRKPGSVGLPVGCEIAVLDEQGHPVPASQVGEVVVRGQTVVDGYDNDDTTVSAFVDNWFHTGDLGRFDEDGYLYLVGRIKETINRGGLTVSPFEIDQVLQSHPAVAQAVAFPIPHASLGEDIAVAVVPAAGGHLTEQEVRMFAASHLDRTLMPSRVIIVDKIPQGPTGKVQRLRLHEQLSAPSTQFARPGTELQATLVAVWQQLLERERIGVHDNFFDLGGDSLRAVRACEAITERTGSTVSVVDLFEFPTIALLTEFLESKAAGQATGPDSEAVRAGRARLVGRRRRGGDHG